MTDETRDDPYLWDRTGEPDEQLRRLERLLERYRLNRPFPTGTHEEPVELDADGDDRS